MNFGELRFWQILLSGLAIILSGSWLCARLKPTRVELFDKIALATLGLTLLLAVNWLSWLIFVFVMLLAFFGMKVALKLERPKQGQAIILPLLFLPLLYYKYADFFVRGALALEYDGFRSLVIPIGISFYTFQKAACVVDTLTHRKPLPRFLDFLNFAAFFPQIVAGPIERREDLLPQMEGFRFRISGAALDEGFGWMALGFFMKRGLADNFAEIFDRSLDSNAYAIWLANLVFGLRIYCDFAGYSLIALGVARCLGVRLTLNFASPYCARNPVEFWRRWHITLSQWFRDYIYVPLGGGRTRYWALTLLIVFVTSGLWHGAGWNFLIWGLVHAILLILTRLFGERTLPAPVAWFGTMAAVFFSWMFFYETNSVKLWMKTASVVNPAAYNLPNLRALLARHEPSEWIHLIGLLALFAAMHLAEYLSLSDKGAPYGLLRRTHIAALLIILATWLAPGSNNEFIYFAF